MKGLIRNNFYSVESTLKWTIAFCILVNIVVVIGLIQFKNIDGFLSIFMLLQIGGFVGLTGTALEKDNTSKWSKYERTLPVKISDVVMARYISFLIFSGIGILLASVTVLLFSIFSNQLMDFERVGYGYTFGIVFALLVPALNYPLVLKFGADKLNMLLLISVLIVAFLFNGASAILTPYLSDLNNANMIYRIACIVISVGVYIMSYFISVYIYKRKEC
ncbi:MAG: ABC-2 transporter permease [Turicibacter sp.]